MAENIEQWTSTCSTLQVKFFVLTLVSGHLFDLQCGIFDLIINNCRHTMCKFIVTPGFPIFPYMDAFLALGTNFSSRSLSCGRNLIYLNVSHLLHAFV